jgi:hypothetical protein
MGSDCAVVALTRGYADEERYQSLIRRNVQIEKNLKDKDVEIILIHEGNISDSQQEMITKKTPSLKLNFIDMNSKPGKAFRKEKEGVQFDEATAKIRLSYRHMCSFWFVDFWNFVEEYDYIIRIDEDCEIDFDLDDRFEKLRDFVAIYGYWFLDLDFVTKGLNEFTVSFLESNGVQCDPRDPWGPYTNIIGFNLKQLRENGLLFDYIESIDESNNIYRYRWGDLPLWGEVICYLYGDNDHFLDEGIKYYHGSHRKNINA